MNAVKKRIRNKFDELSSKQKVVAQYILENPRDVALKSAKEIGKITNTSETTVIRLSYTLEYKGFSELQSDIRSALLDEPNHTNGIFTNFKKLSKQIDQEDTFSYTINQDIQDITEVSNKILPSTYKQVVKKVSHAKKILILGFRSSFAPAYWLHYTLNIVRGNVHLYRGLQDDANYLLTQLNEDWTVIALSFPRYANEITSFAKAAREKSAEIIAITDKELAPIGKYADSLLLVGPTSPTALRGMTSIFAVLHALVMGVAKTDQQSTDDRIQKYTESTTNFNPFYGEQPSKDEN